MCNWSTEWLLRLERISICSNNFFLLSFFSFASWLHVTHLFTNVFDFQFSLCFHLDLAPRIYCVYDWDERVCQICTSYVWQNDTRKHPIPILPYWDIHAGAGNVVPDAWKSNRMHSDIFERMYSKRHEKEKKKMNSTSINTCMQYRRCIRKFVLSSEFLFANTSACTCKYSFLLRLSWCWWAQTTQTIKDRI